MAYTSYEILPARTIKNRIIPRLWKLIRDDGTFDLFCLSSLQHNCIRYLASINQAGAFAGRYDSDNVRNLGEYSVSADNSNFTDFSIYMYDGTRYGSVPNCSLRLVLDNKANIYPYSISGHNQSDHNAGTRILRLYDGNTWSTKIQGSNNWGASELWKFDLANLTSVYDWKDYKELDVMFRARDTSKFTGANASLTVKFVHRYSDGHPLHRYYR